MKGKTMNAIDKTISEIRSFNRFYTVSMRLLDSVYLDTEYSIAETRVLFELHTLGTCIQNDIVKQLHIDKSYLSRMLNRFYKAELINKEKSATDKRATYITLSEKGLAETRKLIKLTDQHIKQKIDNLNSDECNELCEALNKIISILDNKE